jgi:hypothetical protein
VAEGRKGGNKKPGFLSLVAAREASISPA